MESLNNGCKDVLTEQEKNGILYDLFRGQNVDASFLYKGKGAKLYEEISKDQNYPFIGVEKDILQKLRYDERFLKILDKCEYITDVGCGDGQKAIALLGETSTPLNGEGSKNGNINREGKCILEDYSSSMLDIAEKNIRATGIRLGSSQKLNDGKHLSQNLQKNMYLFLGGTICNLRDVDIISELKDMDNKGLLDGNYILLSYFTAPKTEEEIQELIKIYKSESNIKFHENGMDMLGLSKDDFEFDIIYEKDNPEQQEGPFPGKIKGIIRAKKDCIIEVNRGYKTEKINIQKGKEFVLHFSKRFTEDGMKKLFNQGECKIIKSWSSNGGDTITLLEKGPNRIKNVKSKVKNSLIGILIAGIAYGGGSYKAHKEKENRKEMSYNEWCSTKSINDTVGTFVCPQGEDRSESLIKALKLDKLKEKDRESITNMFNVYVRENKNDWIWDEDFIQGFREKYGGQLINRFDLCKPYDFMAPELINNTKNLEKEYVYDKSLKDKNRNVKCLHYERLGEYRVSGRKYLILKAYLFDNPIYLAAENIYNNPLGYDRCYEDVRFDTSTYQKIKDKIKIDQIMLEDNNQFGCLGGRFLGDGSLIVGVDANGDLNNPVIINKYERLGEYSDSGRKYLILKAYLFDKPIYLATEKGFSCDGGVYYDTNTYKRIRGNLDLEPVGLENNNQLGFLCGRVFDSGSLKLMPDGLIRKERCDSINLRGKTYYIITGYTCCNGTVGLASESESGPYTTTKFNEVAKIFLQQ